MSEVLETKVRLEVMKTIVEIARLEKVEPAAALELIVKAGARVYRTKHRLGCGFAGCTRANCCGEFRKTSQRDSSALSLLAGGGPEV